MLRGLSLEESRQQLSKFKLRTIIVVPGRAIISPCRPSENLFCEFLEEDNTPYVSEGFHIHGFDLKHVVPRCRTYRNVMQI